MTTIGIIGGEGRLGSWFANFFRAAGQTVVVSDLNTPVSNEALVDGSDIVIFSVPIRVTEEVIQSVISRVRPKQMLVDLTSLKVKPVEAMLKGSAEVLGLHPMFGATVKTIQGQTVVVCRAREGEHTNWFLNLLTSAGAVLKESNPSTHDQLMAIIQGLNHLSTFAMAWAMKGLGVDITETMSYASPIYRIRMNLMARILAQDPNLYVDIALENPHTADVLKAFQESVSELVKSIGQKDRTGFLDIFKQSADYFGALRESGLKESDDIIHYLAKLSCA